MWNRNLYSFILLLGQFLEVQADEKKTPHLIWFFICTKQNTLNSIKWLVSVPLVTETIDVLITTKLTQQRISPTLFFVGISD